MMGDDRLELERILSTLATREDVRIEGERLRTHMTIVMERQWRKIQALIDLLVDAQSPPAVS